MADRCIDVSGLRIRYRDSGGPGLPIVLSHDVAGSLELWSVQLAGFGVSGLAPGRVKGVVLANAASLGREVFPAFRLMTLPFLGKVMTKPSQKGVALMVSAIVKDESYVSGDLYDDLLRDQFTTGGAAALLATLRAKTNVFGQRKSAWEPSQKLLSMLDVPMLILHGRQDAVLPLRHSEEAARQARNATLIELEDCGHPPKIEKPEAVNKALHEFVTRVSAAQAA